MQITSTAMRRTALAGMAANGLLISAATAASSFTASANAPQILSEPAARDAAGSAHHFAALYSFTGQSGSESLGGLIEVNGKFYGTTTNGGKYNEGTVFELTPGGTETVLYSFTGGSDGAHPEAGLIEVNGNLYSTTYGGGTSNSGTVFEMSPSKKGRWTERVVYSFMGGNDGANPYAGLVPDDSGNLYGVTFAGGADSAGTAFKVTPDGSETVLHTFAGGVSDGAAPTGRLMLDKKGYLYGTTFVGAGTGCGGNGCGMVFKLAPDGTETKLYVFTGGTDGGEPQGGLISDDHGNIYSTAYEGGNVTECTPTLAGCGVVFELVRNGDAYTESVLYTFSGGNDGAAPEAGLLGGKKGILYGVTAQGGGAGCSNDLGCGVVFKLAPNGTETPLHDFTDGADGGVPVGELMADRQGYLYDTTATGGSHGDGIVFKVKE